MIKAVLFRSGRRFDAFKAELEAHGTQVHVLDFASDEWVEFDFADTDIVIYFPAFEYSSNHPQALYRVQDNLSFIHAAHPRICMFPDPAAIPYYSDKYRQYLFLKSKHYPFAETYALCSQNALDMVEDRLGYPMVVKNRFGAGGDYVLLARNRRDLRRYYDVSQLNLATAGGMQHILKLLWSREFFYWLLKRRQMKYPFSSPPLLAQKFVAHDRDLKLVVGDGEVVEAHWRRTAEEGSWKKNIDSGGIGEWSYVPDEPLALGEKLARDLGARWLNIDLLVSEGRYLVSEFSPVWHHYAYREKPNFVYANDYNIKMPLEKSLKLEHIIVESLERAARRRKKEADSVTTALQS